LARAGFGLTVASRTFAKAEALAAEMAREGARVRAVHTAAEVGAAAEVIVSCVPDSPEVEDVHLGRAGTASSARAGAVVVDCSTIAPEAARGIAARLSEKSIRFLDAPVSGGQ